MNDIIKKDILITKEDKIKLIVESLKTVYDPEMPIVDVYTLGLIYNVDLDEDLKVANVLMTFTTPYCPMADMMIEMVKNATLSVVPNYNVLVEVTHEPMWTTAMIKDEDVKRMFL